MAYGLSRINLESEVDQSTFKSRTKSDSHQIKFQRNDLMSSNNVLDEKLNSEIIVLNSQPIMLASFIDLQYFTRIIFFGTAIQK